MKHKVLFLKLLFLVFLNLLPVAAGIRGLSISLYLHMHFCNFFFPSFVIFIGMIMHMDAHVCTGFNFTCFWLMIKINMLLWLF